MPFSVGTTLAACPIIIIEMNPTVIAWCVAAVKACADGTPGRAVYAGKPMSIASDTSSQLYAARTNFAERSDSGNGFQSLHCQSKVSVPNNKRPGGSDNSACGNPGLNRKTREKAVCKMIAAVISPNNSQPC